MSALRKLREGDAPASANALAPQRPPADPFAFLDATSSSSLPASASAAAAAFPPSLLTAEQQRVLAGLNAEAEAERAQVQQAAEAALRQLDATLAAHASLQSDRLIPAELRARVVRCVRQRRLHEQQQQQQQAQAQAQQQDGAAKADDDSDDGEDDALFAEYAPTAADRAAMAAAAGNSTSSSTNTSTSTSVLRCEAALFNHHQEKKRRFGAAAAGGGGPTADRARRQRQAQQQRHQHQHQHQQRRRIGAVGAGGAGSEAWAMAAQRLRQRRAARPVFHRDESWELPEAGLFWLEQVPATVVARMPHLDPRERQHCRYYRFVGSPFFSVLHADYLAAVATHDPRVIAAFAREHPTHPGALLQLSALTEMSGGGFQDYSELVLQAIAVLESTFPKGFSLLSGDCRLLLGPDTHSAGVDRDGESLLVPAAAAAAAAAAGDDNAGDGGWEHSGVLGLCLLRALTRHAHLLTKTACPRAALETAKAALALSPAPSTAPVGTGGAQAGRTHAQQSAAVSAYDPTAILPLLPYYALRAEQWELVTAAAVGVAPWTAPTATSAGAGAGAGGGAGYPRPLATPMWLFSCAFALRKREIAAFAAWSASAGGGGGAGDEEEEQEPPAQYQGVAPIPARAHDGSAWHTALLAVPANTITSTSTTTDDGSALPAAAWFLRAVFVYPDAVAPLVALASSSLPGRGEWPVVLSTLSDWADAMARSNAGAGAVGGVAAGRVHSLINEGPEGDVAVNTAAGAGAGAGDSASIDRLITLHAHRYAPLWAQETMTDALLAACRVLIARVSAGEISTDAAARMRRAAFPQGSVLPLAQRTLQQSDYTDAAPVIPEELRQVAPDAAEQQREQQRQRAADAGWFGVGLGDEQRAVALDQGMLHAFVEAMLPWVNAPHLMQAAGANAGDVDERLVDAVERQLRAEGRGDDGAPAGEEGAAPAAGGVRGLAQRLAAAAVNMLRDMRGERGPADDAEEDEDYWGDEDDEDGYDDADIDELPDVRPDDLS